MSQFWKPGIAKQHLIEDEDGGVLFYSTTPSSSSSKYEGYVSLEKERQRLHVFKYRDAICNTPPRRASDCAAEISNLVLLNSIIHHDNRIRPKRDV
ncbi:hypothetical protein Tco_1386848 [Tanacetum coccineum]